MNGHEILIAPFAERGEKVAAGQLMRGATKLIRRNPDPVLIPSFHEGIGSPAVRPSAIQGAQRHDPTASAIPLPAREDQVEGERP